MTARSVRTACITATAAVAASLVLFGFVGSAGAQYNTTPTVSSSSSTVPAGGTTNLTATGFQPKLLLQQRVEHTIDLDLENRAGGDTGCAGFPRREDAPCVTNCPRIRDVARDQVNLRGIYSQP